MIQQQVNVTVDRAAITSNFDSINQVAKEIFHFAQNGFLSDVLVASTT
jgi:hypothetical protein